MPGTPQTRDLLTKQTQDDLGGGDRLERGCGVDHDGRFDGSMANSAAPWASWVLRTVVVEQPVARAAVTPRAKRMRFMP